jgi:hypothetical protein
MNGTPSIINYKLFFNVLLKKHIKYSLAANFIYVMSLSVKFSALLPNVFFLSASNYDNLMNMSVDTLSALLAFNKFRIVVKYDSN